MYKFFFWTIEDHPHLQVEPPVGIWMSHYYAPSPIQDTSEHEPRAWSSKSFLLHFSFFNFSFVHTFSFESTKLLLYLFVLLCLRLFLDHSLPFKRDGTGHVPTNLKIR